MYQDVAPNPRSKCGPYANRNADDSKERLSRSITSCSIDENNHDTIGTIALDTAGHLASGVSTNGQKFKIPGRIGDSAVTGAGGYADGEVGAAAATGDGDIMMRFLPR